MKVLALLAVFLALPVFAQTAKVIALSPEDTAQAKALYAERAKVEKDIRALQDKVYKVYLTGDKQSGVVPWGLDGHTNVKPGWAYGFTFSEDFKYIVPDSYALPACGTQNTLPCGITIYGIGTN